MKKKVTIEWDEKNNRVSVNGKPFTESMEFLHNVESAETKKMILENVENLFLNRGYLVAVKY